MIMLKDIAVKMGSKTLLQIPELSIPGGKVTVVIGPNGAGKSTFLKLLAGLISDYRGEVLLFGLRLSEWTPKKLARSRAMLSQHYSLPFPMPVRDLVTLGRYPHTPTTKETEIIDEVMTELEITSLQHRNVHTLSGGEQQRMHMARVLLQLHDEEGPRSKLLLLDEPVSSLDLMHQQTLLKIARRCAEKGYTVVIVLHDVNLAIQYADHFLVLKKGQLVTSTSILCPKLLSEVFEIPMHRLDDHQQARHYFFTSVVR